jgi:hypothetical protein
MRFQAKWISTDFDDLARQFCSTVGRQTGIVMDVHPGLREKVKLRDVPFIAPVWMDNRSQAHIQGE